MRDSVLTIGTATMDVLLNVPYAPNGGRVVNSKDRYSFTPGGNGAYTAVAVSRSQTASTLLSRVGEDEQGDRLIRYLKDDDVDTNFIVKDPVNQTGLSVYLLEEYGLGGGVNFKGASAKVSCNNVETAFRSEPAVVTANLEADGEVLNYTASLCREYGLPLILDTVGAYENVRLHTLDGDNIIITGDKEIEILTGIRADSTQNYLRACIALFDKMPLRFAVLKLGTKGAYIYDGKYCELLMSPGLQIVDTTAEHQCFVGAFCSDFLRNYEVDKAAKYALAASNLAASKVGGFASIPTKAEIDNILD
ncbi:MAG: hypothetical protein E7597_00155 [Ruminococcaceae bacterium]|nr:hypothetical protein [Oscillospiraceae bacterium]